MISPQVYFSTLYHKFTQLYLYSEVQEEEEPRVPEKVIRCVWNDQLLKTQELKTTDGKTLEVVFPGYWNFGSGPDFKSAAIRIEGKLYEGDVELHIYGADWKSHGHSKNNEYDNVILHVFLWKQRNSSSRLPRRKESKKNLSRPHIFELELKNYLKKGILQLNEELDFESYPLLNQFNYGLCYKPLSQLTQKKFASLLNNAGDARIQTKMDRFHDRIIIKGYEQVFYEGVAEAMGYPNNKIAFRTLAESLPLEDLKRRTQLAKTDEERLLQIQALLFGVSNIIDFSQEPSKSFNADAKNYFSKLKSIWDYHSSELKDKIMQFKEWKFGKMRPANFPYRRIAGLSHLLLRNWDSGLFSNCLDTLREVNLLQENSKEKKAALKKCFAFFCIEAEDYWSRHYILGGKQLKNSQQLIGPDRSREIIINIVLPIGLIYARASKSNALEAILSEVFSTPKPPADNKWIRFMKRFLLGNQEKMLKPLTSDRQTQGLMQIYQDFCTKNENNCMRCKFPQIVEKFHDS